MIYMIYEKVGDFSKVLSAKKGRGNTMLQLITLALHDVCAIKAASRYVIRVIGEP